ncbi:VOC family protein [Streptomyces sp. NP-1717]|uniref:VOC family protein n=1 Tax=unclassified Streptomyces TaxID=2593676 RepID=UPI001F5CEBC1|nr:VOC family protein [Streptomyces sp. NP-1717]MCI3223956.1 VOC family protein [Streptomyces sp. NP-1717]WTA77298.1 VOC family protein [Streptomyces sp. NBC_00838]
MAPRHPVFGAPCWASLLARDLAETQSFYGAVLGWTFRPAALGDQFVVAEADGVPVASIGALAPTLQVAVAWTPYFVVGDVDATAARIRERSATVAVGPLAFEMGRAALAADRDGAVFGFWEGEPLPDATEKLGGPPFRLELRTYDAIASAIFYGEVLKWADEGMGAIDVSYEQDRVVLRTGRGAGHVVARIGSGGIEAAADPHLRPRWHVSFAVDGVKAIRAAAETAEAMGGAVVATERTAYEDGEQVTLRDPDGGLFTLTDR